MKIKFKYLSACSLLIAASASAGTLTLPVSQDGWLDVLGAGATTVQDDGVGTQLNVATPNPSGAAQYTRKAWFGFDTSALAALGAVNICSATLTLNTGTNIDASYNGINAVRFYGVVNENPGSVDTFTTEDKFDETLLTWANAPGNLAGDVLAGDKVNGAILGDVPLPNPARSQVMTLTGLIGSPLVNFLQQANTNNFITVAATYLGQNNTGYNPPPPFTGLSFRAKEDTGFGAVLTINYDVNPCPVVITAQPTLTPVGTIFTGQSFSLTVAAVGSGTLYYQWRTNGVNIPGANSPTFNRAGATLADSGNYDVVITNAANSVTSAPVVTVTISAITQPVIAQQPVSLTRYQGYPASFTVAATGGLLNYQWYRGATPVGSGTTSPNGQTNTLTLANVQPANAGTYTCTVTNAAGSTNSAGATLTVQVPAPGSFEAATVTNLPLAYYRLNETGLASPVNFVTPNIGTESSAADGTGFFNSTASALAGDANAAANFNVGTYVDVPFDSAVNAAGPFTVEFWAKPDTNTATQTPISSIVAGNSGWLFYRNLTVGSGQWTFRTLSGASANQNVTGGSVTVGAWQHVAGVWDGTQNVLYVNGRPVATNATAATYLPTTTAILSLGSRSDHAFLYTGGLDEPAVYTNALSDAQILAHYEAGTNPAPATAYSTLVQSLNPPGHWRLGNGGNYSPLVATNAGTLGSAINGTYTPAAPGGLTSAVPGPQPPAFPGFEAANKALQIDNGWIATPGLNLNTNTVTITAWIKRNGDNSDFDGLVCTTRANGEPLCGLHFGPAAGNELRYTWNDAGNTYGFSSGLIVPDAIWTFVALVVEPTKATLYMGPGGACLQSAVNNIAAANAAFAQGLFIGRDSTARIYTGDVDDVAVYNRSLSPNEISVLYGVAVPPIPPQIIADPQSQSLVESDTAVFTVAACGSGALTYQWYSNNVAIAGATGPSYSLNNLCSTNSGNFTVVVCGAGCVTSSVPAGLTVAPLTNSTPISQDLVLHLKFDTNYTDSSGLANNGAAGGAPTFVAGQIGGAAVHLNTTNAVRNFVSVAPNASLAFGAADSFSVAFWLKFTGAFQDLPIIGNALNSTYNPGWVFSEDGGQIEWTLNGTVNADPVGGPLINNGTWHHVVAAFDQVNGVADTYVDGVGIDSRSITGVGSLDTSNGLFLGQDPSGTYGANGAFDLDDVGIWRRALTRFDVRAIHASGLEGRDLSTASVLPQLSIALAAGNVTLSWLATPAGNCYTLEAASGVTGPWTAVGTTPTLGGDRYSATVAVTPGSKFYRLRK